jgi:regulatory protein
MQITDIQVQVKTQGRYSIFVDGKFAFGLSELGLINSGIRIGQDISKHQLELLKKEASTDKLYNMALNLISRRPRSKWEIIDYLKGKGAEDAETEQILNTLSNRGYINDTEFAKRWVENRRLLKTISKKKLTLELRQKRIPDEIIKNVMESDQISDIDTLQVEIIKKKRQTRYQDQTKLMQYLARQGYQYDDIKQALANLETLDPEQTIT